MTDLLWEKGYFLLNQRMTATMGHFVTDIVLSAHIAHYVTVHYNMVGNWKKSKAGGL